MPYRDEHGGEIFPPGENLPASREDGPIGRPAEGTDFAWLRSGPVARYRGWRRAAALNAQAGGLTIATKYFNNQAEMERARQEAVLAHEQRALIPLKIEQQRQALNAELLRGQLRVDAMLQAHQRESEIAAAAHEVAMLHQKADKLEAKARVKEARRSAKEAGKKHRGVRPGDDAPEEFRRHWQTEERVRANRSEAEQRIAEIYRQAQAERRNLTPDEIEEVDALGDAAAAAEADVRRRAASGS